MADREVSGIYEIVNLVNGVRYIGSAVNFHSRWREHRRLLVKGTHHSRYLQQSWNEYGADAFDFRILEIVSDRSALVAREQVAIDLHNPELNVSRTAGSTLGVKFTAEGRARLSAALKGKLKGVKRSASAVAKGAAAHRGMRRSAETRAKIAEKARGRKFGVRSDAHRMKLSAVQKGRQKSPEHMAALQAGRARRIFTDADRERLSAWMRNQYEGGKRSRERPPEYREKIASSLRGKRLSEEHRQKISRAALGKKRGPYKRRRPPDEVTSC